jgi:hypothetical protein
MQTRHICFNRTETSTGLSSQKTVSFSVMRLMSPNSTNQFHKHEPYSHTLGDDLTIPGVKCGELAIQRPRKAFV